MFVLTGEGRKAAKTVQDRAELLNSLVAYTGMYRVEGGKWITKVDVAWNPEWIGTEQIRSFTVDGKRLRVAAPWGIRPNWPEKGDDAEPSYVRTGEIEIKATCHMLSGAKRNIVRKSGPGERVYLETV